MTITIKGKGYQFSECTAIALESGDYSRQKAVFCHMIDDEFRDGDIVIFGYELPTVEAEAENMLNDYSAHSSDYETLKTVEIIQSSTVRYFECSYDNREVIEEAHATNDQSILESSATQENICIRALREPTIDEANEFLKNDIGEKKVWFVGELSRSDAYDFYDMTRPTRLFGTEGEVWSND